MKRFAVWLGSLLVLGSVLAIGGVLGRLKYIEIVTAMSAEPPPEQAISVILKNSTMVEYRHNTTVIGTIISPKSIMLSNEIAGTVVSIDFESGDTVDKDKILVELDASVEKAQLQSANAKLKMAKSTLSRTRLAANNRAVSELEVEEADTAFTQAQAEISQLQAIIAKKTLTAPFKARIGLRNTHPGQFLPSGSQIGMLQSIDDFVNVDFMVPQNAADFIEIGNEVKLIDGSTSYVATISAIDAQSDRSTRNLMVRAKLQPIPPQLLPNDSVRVLVEYGPLLSTSAVPVEAVRHAPMKSFVYVAEEDREGKLRARERQVTVGQMIGESFSILSGLEPGTSVVKDGSFKLRDGALIAESVLPPDSTDSPAAAPQETAGK